MFIRGDSAPKLGKGEKKKKRKKKKKKNATAERTGSHCSGCECDPPSVKCVNPAGEPVPLLCRRLEDTPNGFGASAGAGSDSRRPEERFRERSGVREPPEGIFVEAGLEVFFRYVQPCGAADVRHAVGPAHY